MAHLRWSVDEGLHEASRHELQDEVVRLVSRAQSLRPYRDRKRRARLMHKAALLQRLINAGRYE